MHSLSTSIPWQKVVDWSRPNQKPQIADHTSQAERWVLPKVSAPFEPATPHHPPNAYGHSSVIELSEVEKYTALPASRLPLTLSPKGFIWLSSSSSQVDRSSRDNQAACRSKGHIFLKSLFFVQSNASQDLAASWVLTFAQSTPYDRAQPFSSK